MEEENSCANQLKEFFFSLPAIIFSQVALTFHIVVCSIIIFWELVEKAQDLKASRMVIPVKTEIAELRYVVVCFFFFIIVLLAAITIASQQNSVNLLSLMLVSVMGSIRYFFLGFMALLDTKSGLFSTDSPPLWTEDQWDPMLAPSYFVLGFYFIFVALSTFSLFTAYRTAELINRENIRRQREELRIAMERPLLLPVAQPEEPASVLETANEITPPAGSPRIEKQ